MHVVWERSTLMMAWPREWIQQRGAEPFAGGLWSDLLGTDSSGQAQDARDGAGEDGVPEIQIPPMTTFVSHV